MTTASPEGKLNAVQLGLLTVLASMFAYLLYRNLGLNPAIFADEWYYSKMSRLLPLGEAIVPSYLYLWVFSASNSCGDGFLDCVRIGNALWFVAGAPFVYAIARQVTGPALALLAALLSLLAPLNLFTALFMPESMYYFGFCLLSWLALTRTGWGWMQHALALGLVLGLMSLVKVHALFLLPALWLFMLYRGWHQGRQDWLRTGLLSSGVVTAAAFAVKFGLGYVLAGKDGLHLFGPLYSQAANHGKRSMLALLGPAFINARGHLMALAMLLAFPLAMIAHTLVSGAARAQAGKPLAALQMYALLMLGAGAGMTIAYTASLANLGPLEVLRLHLRYYSFVFPLLFIVGLVPLGGPDQGGARAWRVALAVLVGAVALAATVKLPQYAITMIDGPDIAALDPARLPGKVVVGLHLLALLLWAAHGSRLAATVFAFAVLPLVLFAGNRANLAYLTQLAGSWAADRAGKFAHQYVPAPERKLITVAGIDSNEIMRAQFHIDDKDSAMLELPKDAPIEHYQVPPRGKWLLVLGNHPLPPGLQPVAATAEYALVKLTPHRQVVGHAALSGPLGTGLIAAAEGLSHGESWGRWSDAKQVLIHFNAPLPRRLVVVLHAQAYGVNATLPFTMRVGASTARFRLAQTPQQVGLRFDTDGQQRTLTIEVPHPVSPSESGGADDRKLGIGISEIEIGDDGDRAPSSH